MKLVHVWFATVALVVEGFTPFQVQRHPFIVYRHFGLASGFETAAENAQERNVPWPFQGGQPDNDDEAEPTLIRQQSSDDTSEDMNVCFPKTGLSVSDQIEAANQDQFATTVVPIKGLKGCAQLVTAVIGKASLEPVRYLLALEEPTSDVTDYVMVDMPPYSPQLEQAMKSFMEGTFKSTEDKEIIHSDANFSATPRPFRLLALLVTTRDALHRNEQPSMYSNSLVEQAETLKAWRQAFPSLEVVANRIDIPRYCRPYVTQVLDGSGPFAMTVLENNTAVMVETGRPLTKAVWDDDLAKDILSGNQKPPIEEEDNKCSLEAIRTRESGKRLLAVNTPGHTFGSVSYVLPNRGVCASGYTIPVEDARDQNGGPLWDCRGYLTTSKAGIIRQMIQAKALVEVYADRFHTVLPSRDDPLFLSPDSVGERREELLAIVEQYRRLGEVYEQLGVTP